MSRAAKLTLAGTSTGALAIIVLVHYQQRAEKIVSIPVTRAFNNYTTLTSYRLCTQASYGTSSSNE